jgi:hypothetical protein
MEASSYFHVSAALNNEKASGTHAYEVVRANVKKILFPLPEIKLRSSNPLPGAVPAELSWLSAAVA